METIKAVCPKCHRTDHFARTPEDPANAISLTLVCPDCDDGDFHSPDYFNATGEEIDWETGKAH